LCAWLVLRGGIGADQVRRDTPFADYGLDSLAAVELSGELEDWLGLELTPILAWNYPTPQRLAQHLAIEMAGGQPAQLTASLDSSPLDDDAAMADFESLLCEIEAISDDEI
jgi:acyl carrier protein